MTIPKFEPTCAHSSLCSFYPLHQIYLSLSSFICHYVQLFVIMFMFIKTIFLLCARFFFMCVLYSSGFFSSCCSGYLLYSRAHQSKGNRTGRWAQAPERRNTCWAKLANEKLGSIDLDFKTCCLLIDMFFFVVDVQIRSSPYI